MVERVVWDYQGACSSQATSTFNIRGNTMSLKSGRDVIIPRPTRSERYTPLKPGALCCLECLKVQLIVQLFQREGITYCLRSEHVVHLAYRFKEIHRYKVYEMLATEPSFEIVEINPPVSSGEEVSK